MRYKNNPCNIRWSVKNDWRGQIDPKNGFCQFCDLEFGVRAVLRLLETYRFKYNLLTIRQIVSKFAPPKENSTDAYVDYIVESMNHSFPQEGILFDVWFHELYIDSSTLRYPVEYAYLVKHMAFIESRTELDVKYIYGLIKKYNLFRKLWKK